MLFKFESVTKGNNDIIHAIILEHVAGNPKKYNIIVRKMSIDNLNLVCK
jgi:hypothetical protein